MNEQNNMINEEYTLLSELNRDAKNIFRGVVFTLIYITMTIIIPYLTFSWVQNLSIFGVIDIEMTQAQYERIIFWVIAFGLIVSGSAFFAYSSPPQSIRGGIFALIQVILNCFYIWSYRFSGATEIQFEITSFGSFYLNLQQMIIVYLGLYFLTILLKIYDIVDFVVNREKIREKRVEKIRKSKEKKMMKRSKK